MDKQQSQPAMPVSIKDVLGSHPHVWIHIIQNPMKKPLWPPVPVRLNEYMAVLPRDRKVLVAEPLVDNLRYARDTGRAQLQFSEMGTLSAEEAHLVRLQNNQVVFPRTCAAPRPEAEASSSKKGK